MPRPGPTQTPGKMRCFGGHRGLPSALVIALGCPHVQPLHPACTSGPCDFLSWFGPQSRLRTYDAPTLLITLVLEMVKFSPLTFAFYNLFLFPSLVLDMQATISASP